MARELEVEARASISGQEAECCGRDLNAGSDLAENTKALIQRQELDTDQ